MPEALTFSIENKKINPIGNLDQILIQGDKKSRCLQFISSKYFDGVDLSTKTILIKYQNAGNKSGEEIITDVSTKENQMIFKWWVNAELTAFEGKASFQIEIFDKNDANNRIYRFLTLPFDIFVERTLIVNDNAEPVDYYLDIRFLNQFKEEIAYDEIHSTLPPLEIKNRTILMPVLENIAITQDSRSRLVTFLIQRYIDTVDLSLKTICIKYKLANQTGDRSFVCNKEVSDTHIKFDWLLDGKVCSIPGEVAFAIEFIGYNEKKEFYCFNTLPAQLTIQKGLTVDDFIEQPSASWIQSWNILAEKYLREYLEYIDKINLSVEQVKKNADMAIEAAKNAKLSEISAENDAGIAWEQADRAEKYAALAQKDQVDVSEMKTVIEDQLTTFQEEYENIRKKDEKIEETDLSVILANKLNNHTHNVSQIITDADHQFVTQTGKDNLEKARLNDIPIKETDLDSNLALKINGISTGDGGVQITGVQINDNESSWSTTNSSNKIDLKINNATNGLVTKDGDKVLSTNDFSQYYRKKLDSIEENANYFDSQSLIGMSLKLFTQDSTHRLVTDLQMQDWKDKYKKAEVDSLISSISTGLLWKDPVPTFNDLTVFYPDPGNNWTVTITDTGASYTYNGEKWIKFASGTTPIATPENPGLLSATDKAKLDGIEARANQYVLPQLTTDHIVDGIRTKALSNKNKEKLDTLESYLASELNNYRSTSKQIIDSDLSPELMEKLTTADSGLISDGSISQNKVNSSAYIVKLLDDLDKKINKDIDAHLVTESTASKWFTDLGYLW